jgi:peptidoglycan/LPS O-acetylase OafA/YrhL
MTRVRGGRSVAAMTTTLHRIQDERLAGGLAVLLAIGALAAANFAGDGSSGGAGPYAITVAACAIVAAVLFARVLPGVANPAAASWILAALGLISCVVFFTGLPIVLGMGAVYSGLRADRRAPAALGALAVVLGIVGCFVG